MTDTSLPEETKKRGPQMRAVSSLEQAAILMLSMGDEASAGILRNFSREEIVSISQAMARLSNVKQNTVSDVIGRFFDDYKLQSSIKGASRSYLAGMLGHDFYRPYAVTFDFDRMEIDLARGGGAP